MDRSHRTAAAATAAFVILAAAGPAGAADNKQDVRVVNTTAEPVPVAVQGTAPIPVTDPSRPVPRPFQTRLLVTVVAGLDFGQVTYTVPAGKRLVIQRIAMWTFPSSPLRAHLDGFSDPADIGNTAASQPLDFDREEYTDDSGRSLYVANQQILLHAGPTTRMVFTVKLRDDVTQDEFYQAYISGYEEDVP